MEDPRSVFRVPHAQRQRPWDGGNPGIGPQAAFVNAGRKRTQTQVRNPNAGWPQPAQDMDFVHFLGNGNPVTHANGSTSKKSRKASKKEKEKLKKEKEKVRSYFDLSYAMIDLSVGVGEEEGASGGEEGSLRRCSRFLRAHTLYPSTRTCRRTRT